MRDVELGLEGHTFSAGAAASSFVFLSFLPYFLPSLLGFRRVSGLGEISVLGLDFGFYSDSTAYGTTPKLVYSI